MSTFHPITLSRDIVTLGLTKAIALDNKIMSNLVIFKELFLLSLFFILYVTVFCVKKKKRLKIIIFTRVVFFIYVFTHNNCFIVSIGKLI